MTEFISTTNVSLYTIPFAWLTCMSPHWLAIYLYASTTNEPLTDSSSDIHQGKEGAKGSYGFDKAQPRGFLNNVARNPNPKLTAPVKGRIARLEAASLNGYENLGLFCAAAAAANVGLIALLLQKSEAGRGTVANYVWWMNVNSGGYVLSRLMYNACYGRGSSGRVRGSWYYGGLGCCFALAIRAANVLR